MHAQIVVFDGFDPLDVVAPFEVLHAGGAASGGAITVELVSAEDPPEVVSGSGGLVLRAATALDPERADWIVVPGASGTLRGDDLDATASSDIAEGTNGASEESAPPIPVLLARTIDTPLPQLMRRALDDPSVLVATVCGGSLGLAMAGLLGGMSSPTTSGWTSWMADLPLEEIEGQVEAGGDAACAGQVTVVDDAGVHRPGSG